MAPDPLDNLPPWEPPKPATDAQIAAFERLIGSNLPADYREYLRTVNGGPPKPHNYYGPVIRLYVQYIYSLVDDEDELSGLIYEWRAASDMPETFRDRLLPVAHVGDGDRLFLSLLNGEVFYHFQDEDSFTRIDDSFSSILKNIKGDDGNA
jgi:hypothetical protein